MSWDHRLRARKKSGAGGSGAQLPSSRAHDRSTQRRRWWYDPRYPSWWRLGLLYL